MIYNIAETTLRVKMLKRNSYVILFCNVLTKTLSLTYSQKDERDINDVLHVDWLTVSSCYYIITIFEVAYLLPHLYVCIILSNTLICPACAKEDKFYVRSKDEPIFTFEWYQLNII